MSRRLPMKPKPHPSETPEAIHERWLKRLDESRRRAKRREAKR